MKFINVFLVFIVCSAFRHSDGAWAPIQNFLKFRNCIWSHIWYFKRVLCSQRLALNHLNRNAWSKMIYSRMVFTKIGTLFIFYDQLDQLRHISSTDYYYILNDIWNGMKSKSYFYSGVADSIRIVAQKSFKTLNEKKSCVPMCMKNRYRSGSGRWPCTHHPNTGPNYV